MSLVTKNFTFSAGATIIASEHNDNFDTLYNLINGNIDNNNIVASAAIANSKLNLTSITQAITFATITNLGTVTTADINGGTLDGVLIGATSPVSATFSVLTASSMTLASGVAATAILDDDTMVSNSATAVPTQKSTKAYIDGKLANIDHAVAYVSGNNSWTAPAGVTKVWVTMSGGGGGGGGGGTNASGGGGGAACIIKKEFTVVPTSSYTANVGAAGTAGSTDGNGGAGGASTFDAISVNGGAGGSGSGGAAGAASTGRDLSFAGAAGTAGGGDNGGAGGGCYGGRGGAGGVMSGGVEPTAGVWGGGGGGSFRGATLGGAAGGSGFILIEY